jgi:hypothetical protein
VTRELKREITLANLPVKPPAVPILSELMLLKTTEGRQLFKPSEWEVFGLGKIIDYHPHLCRCPPGGGGESTLTSSTTITSSFSSASSAGVEGLSVLLVEELSLLVGSEVLLEEEEVSIIDVLLVIICT